MKKSFGPKFLSPKEQKAMQKGFEEREKEAREQEKQRAGEAVERGRVGEDVVNEEKQRAVEAMKKKRAEEGLDKEPEGEEKKEERKEKESELKSGQKKEALEDKEKAAEKSPLELARESYASALLAYDQEKKRIGFENLTEEKKLKYMVVDPEGKKLYGAYESAKKAYFVEREKDLAVTLEKVEAELREKGLDRKAQSLEMKKALTMHLASEFKHVYDAKTELLAQKADKGTLGRVKDLIYKVGNAYASVNWKYKLAIAGALMAGGAAVGAASGGVGLALGTVLGAGGAVQRALAGASVFVGLEGFLQKRQAKAFEKEAEEAYQKIASEVFDKSTAKTAGGLIKFMRRHDTDLERKFAGASAGLQKTETLNRYKRAFIAGGAGFLVNSGFIAQALGFESGVPTTEGAPTEEAAALVTEATPAEEVVKAVQEETANKLMGMTEKGQGISQALWEHVENGTVTKEQLLSDLKNSYVEIDGAKVRLIDVSDVPPGTKLAYVPGTEGAAGNIQVISETKLGTNIDLYNKFVEANKPVPEWLEKARLANIEDALKSDTLDANTAKVLTSHFEHGTYGEKEEIMKHLFNKMREVGPEEGGAEFTKLFSELSNAESWKQAVEGFPKYINHVTGLTPEQYDAVKDMNVKEFLAKRGSSWWKDYFWSQDMPYAGTQEGRAEEIFRQRKLADFIRTWRFASSDMTLTVEQFLKRIPAPWY